MGKVVELKAKQQQETTEEPNTLTEAQLQAEQQAEEEWLKIFKDMPEEIVGQLSASRDQAYDLSHKLYKYVSDYANSLSEGRIDLSIPIEAMAITSFELTAQGDHQLPEESLKHHLKVRDDLAGLMVSLIQSFIKEKIAKNEPIMAHDVFIAMLTTLINETFNYRYGIAMNQLQEKEQSNESEQSTGETSDNE